ncbi:hypothetical protein JR316_0002246 [Psilocybe cubensis]|uniref:Uncharacterized protein n=1 Tax=Psilocybe cubensis TaxID=181762 RepID=A0ACB8HC23_PSICU|nr:hypothetical protein JR316_0002246 [Psilocybe cubensis]KAH9485338.1 hypothetical protein JR316_0002246 [Psilocybe cubensis]
MPGANVVFKGDASAIRNRACQALKVGNVRLGHSAYMSHPGEFAAPPNRQVIAAYNQPCSSSSVPLARHPEPTFNTTSNLARPAQQVSRPEVLMVPQMRYVLEPISVNFVKFSYTPLPSWPSANTSWVNALHQVRIDPYRVWDHGFLDSYRGYAFFDPHILLGEDWDRARGKTYLLAWLAVRPAWMAKMINPTVHQEYPQPQSWRDFLIFHIAKLLRVSDRDVKCNPDRSISGPNKRRKQGNLIAYFDLPVRNYHNTTQIRWRDDDVGYAGSLDVESMVIKPSVPREVVWDLFEHNFRFELLALDRSIFPRHLVSDQLSLARDTLVTNCFPQNALITVQWPERDEGLGARRYQDRVLYVESLRKLMSDWPGSVATALRRMSLSPNSTEQQVSLLSKQQMPRNFRRVRNQPPSSPPPVGHFLPLAEVLPLRHPYGTATQGLALEPQGLLYGPSGIFSQPLGVTDIAIPQQPGFVNDMNMGDLIEVDELHSVDPERAAKNQRLWQMWNEVMIPRLMKPYLNTYRETSGMRAPNRVRYNVGCQGCSNGGLLKVSCIFFENLSVLDFVQELFTNMAPNTVGWCNTLEAFLSSRNFKLTTRNSLRDRFASAMKWYATLVNRKDLLMFDYLNRVRVSELFIMENNPSPDQSAYGHSTVTESEEDDINEANSPHTHTMDVDADKDDIPNDNSDTGSNTGLK